LSTWTYASWTMVAHHTCHGVCESKWLLCYWFSLEIVTHISRLTTPLRTGIQSSRRGQV
jgi:hypothetical protein